MKRNVILLVRLAKEIESELQGLKKLLMEYQEMPQERTTYLLRAKASIFHDFYTAIERIMMKIAEELNGGLPKSDQWHKDLLFDMTIDLEGIRPPLFPKECYESLYSYLRFRHLFRNNYGYELKPELLKSLEDAFPDTVEKSMAHIQTFCSWLRSQAEEG
jgi:hypothetical protein